MVESEVGSIYRRKIGLDVMASLGLAGIFLSHNLSTLLSSKNVYFAREAQRDHLLGWLICLGVLTLVSYGVLRLRRRGPKLGQYVLYLALPIVIEALYQLQLSFQLPFSLFAVAFAAVAVLCYFKVWRIERRTATIRVVGASLSLCGFFVLVCFLSAVWAIGHPYRTKALHLRPDLRPQPPIVWVVFDELDEGWLFDHRPPNITFPEFDQLRNQSVTFNDVQRPGPATVISLPALIAGQAVRASKPESERDLRLRFVGGGSALWSKTNSVFDAMYDLGRSSTIVGFYHNYETIFSGKVSHVSSEAYNFFGILPSIEYQFWLLFPSQTRFHLREWLTLNTPQHQAEVTQHKIWLQNQLTATRAAIEGRHSSFIFLHIGIPHAPWLNSSSDESHVGYLSNLTETDRFLKEIRLSLQRAKSWAAATVVVTSDHNFRLPLFGRPLNEKVPLMVKLPGQEKGLSVETRVNAVDERWLIEAIANKKVQTPGEVVAFMCALAKRGGNRFANSTQKAEDSLMN